MTRRRAIARRIPIVLAALLALAAPAWTQETGRGEPRIPAPTGFVNDEAGVLDASTQARLEAFLVQVRDRTGAEYAVLIVPNTAPLTPSEYKVQVFERWGLGKRGQDNGLLMLVALEEREVRFETGYGLEGVLPDGLQSRIFREVMAPRFQAGDMAGGVVAGVQAIAARIAAETGDTLTWEGRELRYDETPASSGRRLPAWAVLLIFFVLVMVMSGLGASAGHRRRGRRSVWGYPGWGGGFGGMGGWGGGFGGGGGGGGFGGFGGGASGGGGGGGRW